MLGGNLGSLLYDLFMDYEHIGSRAKLTWRCFRDVKKPVFRVSDQVRHKLGCKATKMVRGLKFRNEEVE